MSDQENHQAAGDPSPADAYHGVLQLTNERTARSTLSMTVHGERYEVQRTIEAAVKAFREESDHDRIDRLIDAFSRVLIPALQATGVVRPQPPPPPEPMFWRPPSPPPSQSTASTAPTPAEQAAEVFARNHRPTS